MSADRWHCTRSSAVSSGAEHLRGADVHRTARTGMPITSLWLPAIPRAIAIHPAPPPERSVAPCLGIVGSATHGNTGHKTPTLWGPRVGLERASLGTHGASGLDSREWRSEMADNVVQVRFGTPGNVLEVQVGTVE